MTAAATKFESFKWMRGVADDHRITQFRRFILIRLCLFRNPKNGRCDPSYETVAEILNVDRATVIRAAEDGVRYGWLAPPTHRRRRTNLFAFTFPIGWQQHQRLARVGPSRSPSYSGPTPVQLVPLPCPGGGPARKESQPCDSLDGSQPCDPNGIRSKGEAKASPLAGRENEPSVLDAPGSGRAPLRGAPEPLEDPEGHLEAEPGGTSPRGGRGKEDAKTGSQCKDPFYPKPIPAGASSSAGAGQAHEAGDGVHAAWRALVELWALRPWPITPRELAIARMVFVAAIAAGTPIDAILSGAGAWVSGIDDPRYLKALPQWLQAKAWEHEPPAKRKRQASGQGRGYRRREKTDLASLMYALGQMP